jgi:hypothetical protein
MEAAYTGFNVDCAVHERGVEAFVCDGGQLGHESTAGCDPTPLTKACMSLLKPAGTNTPPTTVLLPRMEAWASTAALKSLAEAHSVLSVTGNTPGLGEGSVVLRKASKSALASVPPSKSQNKMRVFWCALNDALKLTPYMQRLLQRGEGGGGGGVGDAR